jgi:hypothetical protein
LLLLDHKELNSRIAIRACHHFLKPDIGGRGINWTLKYRQNR